jgi:ABC-2 type transport system ATP-binding protein
MPKIDPTADVRTSAAPYRQGMTGNLAIDARGVEKRFRGRLALDGVDLAVPEASAFGFLGPNGAGKTTLIRSLLGLTEPTAGDVRVLGLPVPARRRDALARVGAIVEEPRFHPHLTGRENLRLNAAARGGAAVGRIGPALERVGLAERADDRVGTYSMGMRQRLGIARCLLADPALLILDEPMNGLDPAGFLEFRALIREFVAEGRTVFLSSHLLDEVERTCDVVAIIDRGRIVAQGTVDEVVRGGSASLLIGATDPGMALAVLAARADVLRATDDGEALRVVLAADADPAEVNRGLVEAGVAVRRFEPARLTLEERFLELTTTLGEAR